MNNDIIYAAKLLESGECVAIPTETVYGLAANAFNDVAIAKIYLLKKRPSFNPLILHVNNFEEAEEYAEFSFDARKLAKKFWGRDENHKPLTIVMPIKINSKISKIVTAGLDSIAIRVPNHQITNELMSIITFPIAAPSANPSSGVTATNARMIRSFFGNDIKLVLDGGQTKIGIESTIVDATKEKISVLRYGSTVQNEIKSVIGYTPEKHKISGILAPGMLSRHYAPGIKIFLNQDSFSFGEAFLDFGGTNKNATMDLSKTGDLVEAAANFFMMINELDDPEKFSSIRVAKIPEIGLGVAINDRLRRASAEI